MDHEPLEYCDWNEPKAQQLFHVLLTEWRKIYGGHGRSIAGLLEDIEYDWEGTHIEIGIAVKAIAFEHEKINPQKLGRFIGVYACTLDNGFHFERAGRSRTGAIKWRVRQLIKDAN